MCWVKIVKQGLEEGEEEKAGGGWGEIHVISGQLRDILLQQADLATGREHQLTTGKCAEKLNTMWDVQFAGLLLVKPVV